MRKLCRQISAYGRQLDMIHIDDVIDAFALAINRLEEKSRGTWFDRLRRSRRAATSDFEAFNIAAGVSAPAIELISKILAITQSASPVQTLPGDDRFPDRYVGSIEKAATVLGFRARVDIDDGVHRLAMAYLDETVHYLKRKLEADCLTPHKFSNTDLLALDGCTGTVAAEGPGQVGYLFQNDDETDLSVRWGWRDDVEPQTWNFHVETEEAGGGAVIRFARQDSEGQEEYFQVRESGQILGEGETRFLAPVDPSTGYISLVLASSERPLESPYIDMTPLIPRQIGRTHSFRITPFCCPGKKSPWPFFKEDPLASAINDLRFEVTRNFTASPTKTACHRIQEALDVAQAKLDRLQAMSSPVQLQQAPLPFGSPADWRHRHLPICSNLCDHPTICLDTAACACAQSSCVPRLRFPFTAFANLPGLSYPAPTLDWAALSVHDPDILVTQVAQSSWRNVLRPAAARYLGRDPEFPLINLTKLPDEVQRDRDGNPNDYDQVRSTGFGCFSADAVLERGVKLISRAYTPDSLVFLPYYAGTKSVRPPSLVRWLH